MGTASGGLFVAVVCHTAVVGEGRLGLVSGVGEMVDRLSELCGLWSTTMSLLMKGCEVYVV